MALEKQKAEIIFNKLDKKNIKLKAFISASAIGYYGAVSTDRVFDESATAADDFLGQTCRDREEAADRFHASESKAPPAAITSGPPCCTYCRSSSTAGLGSDTPATMTRRAGARSERLTSEIVMKAALMEISVIVSRSGITHMGLELARELGITMIARVKGKKFLIFNGNDHFVHDV